MSKNYTFTAGDCIECGQFSKSLRRTTRMCTTCHHTSLNVEDGESPCTLTGRWVPNGRSTLDYVEAVAS